MPVYISRARLVLITFVSVVSILGGIALVFRLGTRSGLERLHTYEIVAMLGLLFLPLVTLWAFYADVRASRVAAARAESERGLLNLSTPSELGVDPDEHGERPVRTWAGAAVQESPAAHGSAFPSSPDRPGEEPSRDRPKQRIRRDDGDAPSDLERGIDERRVDSSAANPRH